MSDVFNLFVSYAQIAVFSVELDSPFNDWSDRHVAQGFAWRPESVAFAVPFGGDALVEILAGDSPSALAGEAARIIMTPYAATGGVTAVASIGDEKTIALQAGDYQLVFELVRELVHDDLRYDYGIRLRFTPTENPTFRIVKADAEMAPGEDLLLTAEPAK